MSCKLKSLADSFRFAMQGVWHCIRRERNFRIHMVAAAYVVALAVWLGLDRLPFAVLFLTISNVLVMEMLNTAIEALVDLTSPEVHPLARIAKDVAAGAVLVSAAVSVVVGVSLLWRPDQLLYLAGELLASPVSYLLLAGSVCAALWFIFCIGGKKKDL